MAVQPLTKRALIEQGVEALDPEQYADKTVAHRAQSGVSYVNLPQVVEVAKFMAAAGDGVPPHCRGNVGLCLRITFNAVEWQMSPFSVADQTYIVNGRLAYMSRVIHAVVEARALLQKRLECEYEGEGPERVCIVRGKFIGGFEREYQTPKIKDIRVKNSPLWKDDPDQQLFYFATRSWARKWCPDVLLGVYTKEEMQESPQLGREIDGEDIALPSLHDRLRGAQRPDDEEGHREGFAARELAMLAPDQTIEHEKAVPTEEQQETQTESAKPKTKAKPNARGRKAATAEPVEPERATTLVNPKHMPTEKQVTKIADRAEHGASEAEERLAAALPQTVKAYVPFAQAWIKAASDADLIRARWASERQLRNAIGMTSEEREPLDILVRDRIKEIESGNG